MPLLYHELFTSDHNASERAFRTVKVKGKISGQFSPLQAETLHPQPRSIFQEVVQRHHLVVAHFFADVGH